MSGQGIEQEKSLDVKMQEDMTQLESVQVPAASSEGGEGYLPEKFDGGNSVELDRIVYTDEEEKVLGRYLRVQDLLRDLQGRQHGVKIGANTVEDTNALRKCPATSACLKGV